MTSEDCLLVDVSKVYLDNRAFTLDEDIESLHTNLISWGGQQVLPLLITQDDRSLETGYLCVILQDEPQPLLVPVGRLFVYEDGEFCHAPWHPPVDPAHALLLEKIAKQLDLPEVQLPLVDSLAETLITKLEERIAYLQGTSTYQTALVLSNLLTPPAGSNIQQRIDEQQAKLEQPGISMQEREIIQEYINVLLSIPSKEAAPSNLSVQELVAELNKTHHGLEQQKIVLAALVKLFLQSKTYPRPICLLGPPGTGKSSIAASLAKALALPCNTIHLGGEADPRNLTGFNRTYRKAKPGAIINTMITAKATNPIIIFNEVDKSSNAVQNVLLNLFDPTCQQYVDQFIDTPIDVSKCLFICTANEIHDMIPALRDRLLVIRIPKLSRGDKEKLITDYLLPSINENAGTNFKLDDNELLQLLCTLEDTRVIESQLLVLAAWAASQGTSLTARGLRGLKLVLGETSARAPGFS